MAVTVDADPAPAPAAEPESSCARSLRPWRVAAWAVGAAAFATYQWAYTRGPITADAITYFEKAASFPDLASDHWSLRVGILLPVRALQEVFGYSEAAYFVFPFAAAAALVASTYWLGRLLFGPAVGAAAAVAVVPSFPFITYSSSILPDHIAAAMFLPALAIVAVVADRAVPWSRNEHGLLVLAGLLFGWAYLTREFIAVLFPLVAFLWWRNRIAWRDVRWVALPAAGVFAAEFVFNWVNYGRPFERFLVSGSHGGQRDWITDSRIDALVRLPRSLADHPSGDVLAVLACLVGLGLLTRQRPWRLLGVWFLLLWVAITLGSGLVVPDFRFLRSQLIRYWIVIVPALLIAGFGFVQAVGDAVVSRSDDPRVRRAGPIAVAAVVVSLGVLLASYHHAGVADVAIYRRNDANQLAQLRDWLATDGDDVAVVWTDSHTARLIEIYRRDAFGGVVWDGDVRPIDVEGEFVDPSSIDEGAVVFYRFGYRSVSYRWQDIPAGIRRLQPGWRTVLRRADDTLLIYRLP